MAERSRWLLLVLSLIIAMGGGLAVLYVVVADNEADRQRDLCDLVAVFDDPSAPAPTTERGRSQVDGIRAYRAKRC